jgi:hypothetical protein
MLTADTPVALYVDGIILARSAGSAFEMAVLGAYHFNEKSDEINPQRL